MNSPETSNLLAILGPTNTGKTHYAVERMLGHSSGMIGFPLRLLAREVYDRVVAIKGKALVALITGEEKIVPERAAYFLCTVESMPMERDFAFVGIDEVQMAADPQRGHVFTDRILRARGREETMFMGADTVRPLLKRLIPDVQVTSRKRFSELKYVRPSKISRLPRRTAIVAFSANDVYAIAELVRRQRGGAAIVMGALSPRTRNSQVELYQSGDVDYLVATDAIGMGLNMDVDHVAFASLRKFDGNRLRNLTPPEIAQIAGRAGRHMNNGTFSTVNAGSNGHELDPVVVTQIEEHRFQNLKALQWRNPALDFASPDALIYSLEKPARIDGLHRVRECLDLIALKSLNKDEEVKAHARGTAATRQLWDVCQIPDFRQISPDDHISLLSRIYHDLMRDGVLSHDWMARQVARLDNVQGDIDTLAGRIASIRIWTYVSHRRGWLEDPAHWAGATRAIEDKLSDALHDRLTQRFVDRRTAVLMREMKQRDQLLVSIDDKNEISVEGHYIGKLEGFSFVPDEGAVRDDHKMLKTAAERTVREIVTTKVRAFAAAPDTELSFDLSRGLATPDVQWKGATIAHLQKSDQVLQPRVQLITSSMLQGEEAELARARIEQWIAALAKERLEPLTNLNRELGGEAPAIDGVAPLAGMARGIAFRVSEHLGVLPRNLVAAELRDVDQDARKGIRIGATALYMPAILKPAGVELRLILWAIHTGTEKLPDLPTPGMVWVEADKNAPVEFYSIAGFRIVGKKAVRIDMLERLADGVRPLGDGGKEFEVSPELMGLVGCSGDDFADVMRTLGYRCEKRKITPESKPEKPQPEELKAEESKEAETAAPAEIEAPKPDVPEMTGIAAEESTPSEPSNEPVEPVERLFFRWAPNRPRKPRPGPRKGKPSSKPDQTKGNRPPHKKGNRPQQRNEKRRQKQPEKPMDPDSPFAALAVLKESMKKK